MILGTGHKVCVLGGGGVEGKLGGGETNYDICGGYETKNEWNTMSMINVTTGFYNTIYFQKIECMFLNVLGRKLQCSTVVFMKVSRSELISLTCLQPERSLITLFLPSGGSPAHLLLE